MNKLILIVLLILFSSFTDNNVPRKGDSILNDAVKVCGYVNNHCLIYYYKDCDLKFGFIHARVLDFLIIVEPEFDDVFTASGYNVGCLVWVQKGSKWAVFDIDDYELKTEFLYTRIGEFKETSYDEEFHKGVYEAKAELDGEIVTVSIEKYVCSSYYPY